jgi:methylenetetrahydrofolate reductase (NADPH)
MPNKFTVSDINFSLEVFPPKTEAGIENLMRTIDAYVSLKPSTITVTFGTGGAATAVYSREAIRRIAARVPIAIAAHLTCAGRSRDEIKSILDEFYAEGVRHIVALRGDMLQQNALPQGAAYRPIPEGYATTPEFIAAIRAYDPGFKISVAGYPETHPESPSVDFDIDHLKRKVDAGADNVLSQFFFDPDVFLRWRDLLAARGVKATITPGLLPILNFPKMLEFAKKCNANVPPFLHAMFTDIDPDSIDHKLLAMNVLSHQITRLVEHGVKDFHFYTLNDTLLTRHICTWIRTGL